VVRIDSARILPAVFSTPVAQLRSSDTKYKCLAFFLKSHYYTERAHRLDVSVFYPNTNETFTREIAVLIPFVWQEINLKVDPDKVEAQFSFKATYLHGLPLINSLVVDDIELRATQCKGTGFFFFFGFYVCVCACVCLCVLIGFCMLL
jgi:hypothetical protein